MDARQTGDYSFKARKNKCEIHRLLVNIIDEGPEKANAYGKNIFPEHGIQVLVKSGDTEKLLTEIPIKANWDWSAYCYDTRPTQQRSADRERYLVRWSFSKSGSPLHLDRGDELIVRIRDDLTALEGHTFNVQGNYA